VLSAKGHRVWAHLEKELVQYNQLLETRSGQLHEVVGLQRQNDELRTLLNQYLSSKINEELVIPPTQVI
jgi:dynein regulatory complex protein 1